MRRTIVIDTWSDYVCPYCYLEQPVLQQVVRDGGVEVNWRAFELRPEPAPLLDPQSDYLRRTWESSVYPMAEERALKLNLPPVQPRSREAFETAEFARAKNKFETVHLALFRAFFEDGLDIGDTTVLLDLAIESGLDPSHLLGSLETKQFQPKVLADERTAHRLGINAAPTMVFHFPEEPLTSGFLLSGAQPLSAVRDIIDKMRRFSAARER